MVVKICPLELDQHKRETAQRGTPMLPCGGYVAHVGHNLAESIPWHWHAEVELLMVVQGSIKIEIPNQTVVLKTAEMAFINANVLHSAVNISKGTSVVKSLVFNPAFIFGTLESAIEQKYVRPVLQCSQLAILPFRQLVKWQQDAIAQMQASFAIYQQADFGYELLLREHLSRIWLAIVSNYHTLLQQQQNKKNIESTRVKQVLDYIAAHYADQIDLQQLADVTSVSSRECLRCFKMVLGTTPMKYVLTYRIAKAADLLTNTDANITEICQQTGFASPSYFALKFRELNEMTPREFRQHGEANPFG